MFNVEFDHANTVSHMDRWLEYLVRLKATPLLLLAKTDEGHIVTCSPEGLQELPFIEVMEVLAGWAAVEVDEL